MARRSSERDIEPREDAERLTSTVGAASTTYGHSSGTHRLATLPGARSKTYTVDAAGNMTSDGTTTWVYGGNNRPTSAGSTMFLINALGRQVKKTTGGAAVRFVYDEEGRLWGEYDAAGALIQEAVWLGDLPIATLRPNGSWADIFYVHPDHLGTLRAVTRSSDKQFVWKWDNTEAFGNSAPNENPSGLGTFAFNLRFPGQYFDAETGKHYNYFRDYDPSLGRYIQSDPIGLQGGLSTYGYVRGNPLSRLDPTGLLDEGGKGGDGQPGGQGMCNLLAPVTITPGFTVCIYLCKTFECPPKVWVETRISTWKWGCQDRVPGTGHRGREGPLRPAS